MKYCVQTTKVCSRRFTVVPADNHQLKSHNCWVEQPGGSQLNYEKYGELIVLGCNGCLPSGDRGRRRSNFSLFQRPQPTGVKPVKNHLVSNVQASELVKDNNQHSVSYTLGRGQAIIVQYDMDNNTDMFQIGRSAEAPIDFVVIDTAGSVPITDDSSQTQSTISRFACRILVDRTPPHTARLYAAGFDSKRNIFLGEKATKWQKGGEIDGLTTNGILIMHPPHQFGDTSSTGVWREVSVGGGVYQLRESRSTPQQSHLVESESNILQDGTLIDLCGATLLWRSAKGLSQSPSYRHLADQIEAINRNRPQCPVGLTTLVLPTKQTLDTTDRSPFVYMNCGHVHGQHSWGKDKSSSKRTCPMCRTTGPFVKLQLGLETSVYVDEKPPNYCFCPCGHMASEATVKYWSAVPIPYGCHTFRAICPFCSAPLEGDLGYQRLLFQENCD